MRYSEIITEEAVQAISPQQAYDAKMFGPLYHGTQHDLSDIIATGFDTKRSVPSSIGRFDRPLETSNGYAFKEYALGIAAPVHHLGFGTYMTTVKAIAKQYAGGTTKGQRMFYLDSQRVVKINFGAPNTMMKWWRENGYDMTAEATKNKDMKAWVSATQKLTDNLSKRYDAVHFLGKGIRKLLDGDQVCIYDTSLIRVIDPKLATGLEIGSKVTHTQQTPSEWRGRNAVYADEIPDAGPGWRGLYDAERSEEAKAMGRQPYAFHVIPPPGMVGVITNVRSGPKGKMYDVKWQKGGNRFNYTDEELQPK